MLHPCDHMPAQVWLCVTDKLSPQDLVSLSDAHPFWYKLLERRRPEFLMELCFPVVADSGVVVPLKDVLNIRLLSKACSRSVEHYFQHHVYESKPFINEKFPKRADFDAAIHTRDIVIRGEVVILNPRIEEYSLQKFETLMDSVENASPASNPFLSRMAAFNVADLDTVEQRQGLLNQITRFLKAYGRHLIRCMFIIELVETPFWEQKYSMLKEWLGLVPNLVSLDVIFNGWLAQGLVDDTDQLETHIQNNPLPELPHLLRLKTWNLSPPFQNILLEKYSQIEMLDIAISAQYNELTVFHPIQMGNLKTLTIRVGGEMHLANFQRLLSDSWLTNLKTLKFYADSQPSHQWWSDIIQFLNSNFGAADKLTQLHLKVPNFNIEKDGKPYPLWVLLDTQNCRLRLPRVEELVLSVENVFLLDFLLPMRQSLKKLAVLNDHDAEGDRQFPTNKSIDCLDFVSNAAVDLPTLLPAQHNIQWNGWLGEHLLSSNIWTAFPNLDFLRVQKAKGWTYRRRLGKPPVLTRPDGRELMPGSMPNPEWDQLAAA